MNSKFMALVGDTTGQQSSKKFKERKREMKEKEKRHEREVKQSRDNRNALDAHT